MSLAQVVLIGNLGADPELRQTTSGKPVANFNLCTNERITRNGAVVDSKQWWRITAWGKAGEILHEHLRKGREVYLEGRLTIREWADRDGILRTTPEVTVTKFKFLGASERRVQSAHATEATPAAVADAPAPTEEESPADAIT